jgi:hypothetical protein
MIENGQHTASQIAWMGRVLVYRLSRDVSPYLRGGEGWPASIPPDFGKPLSQPKSRGRRKGLARLAILLDWLAADDI